VDAETRAYLEAMQETLIRRMEQLNAETRRDLSEQLVMLNAETRAHAGELNAQTRRELGTMIEAVDDKVRLVAEGVIGLREDFSLFAESTERRLERLEAHLP
jgi:hypothetical protein